MKYRPSDFHWIVRKVKSWTGKSEIMIEIAELDYCVSFGLTVKEAKQGLEEALYQWIRKHGINRLPEVKAAAQIFFYRKGNGTERI